MLKRLHTFNIFSTHIQVLSSGSHDFSPGQLTTSVASMSQFLPRLSPSASLQQEWVTALESNLVRPLSGLYSFSDSHLPTAFFSNSSREILTRIEAGKYNHVVQDQRRKGWKGREPSELSTCQYLSLSQGVLRFSREIEYIYSLYICVRIYIYIERERERERIYIFYICVCVCVCIYIYIYIWGWGERERKILIDYKKMPNEITEAEKPHNLQSVNWRPRKASDIVPVRAPRPENQGSQRYNS